MSETPAWVCVCSESGPHSINAADFCIPAPELLSSPIDSYYEFSEHVLQLGTPQGLGDSHTLGRLLLLGLVSGVEAYFRQVLSSVLRLCPISREHASEQQVALGAIDYYGSDQAELGIFDKSSLASYDGVANWTKKLTGLPVQQGSAVAASLLQFDRICHLRHAAVHAQGTLGSGSVKQVGLAASGRVVVSLDFAALQNAGAACHVAVRTYNRWLYEELVGRWHASGRLARVWVDDRPAFEPLYELFRSARDASGPAEAKDAYRLLPFGVRLRR